MIVGGRSWWSSSPASAATGQPARGAGSFKDCPHCPEMVSVPSGSFVMGDEQPPRRVTIDYRFAYSKDKVSFRDWKHCVLGGQCQSLGATGTASLEPVVHVSWVDVQQYLSWLSLETGAEYRLLSEAEWEYLAGVRPPACAPTRSSGRAIAGTPASPTRPPTAPRGTPAAIAATTWRGAAARASRRHRSRSATGSCSTHETARSASAWRGRCGSRDTTSDDRLRRH